MTTTKKAAPARTGTAIDGRESLLQSRPAASTGWRECKACGDAGELLAADLLRRLGFRVHRFAGFHPGFDLKAWGALEVKSDAQALWTGNLAIEVSYRGAPSGITTSTADAWVFIVGDAAYFVPTQDLRALLDCGLYRRVAAGDAATCELVPLSDLAASAVRIPLAKGARHG